MHNLKVELDGSHTVDVVLVVRVRTVDEVRLVDSGGLYLTRDQRPGTTQLTPFTEDAIAARVRDILLNDRDGEALWQVTAVTAE